MAGLQQTSPQSCGKCVKNGRGDSPEMLRSRLIERKMASGVPHEKAVDFVDFSDMPNARLCLEKSLPADLTLQVQENGVFCPVPAHT